MATSSILFVAFGEQNLLQTMTTTHFTFLRFINRTIQSINQRFFCSQDQDIKHVRYLLLSSIHLLNHNHKNLSSAQISQSQDFMARCIALFLSLFTDISFGRTAYDIVHMLFSTNLDSIPKT